MTHDRQSPVCGHAVKDGNVGISINILKEKVAQNCSFLQHYVIVTGGISGKTPSIYNDVTEVYDVAAGTWSIGTSIPQAVDQVRKDNHFPLAV